MGRTEVEVRAADDDKSVKGSGGASRRPPGGLSSTLPPKGSGRRLRALPRATPDLTPEGRHQQRKVPPVDKR